jgi:hypothetical protein
MTKIKRTKGQTTIYKTLHKKLKIEQPIPPQIMSVRRVALVTNPEINHECGKDRIVITTKGTHPWSCMTKIPCNE